MPIQIGNRFTQEIQRLDMYISRYALFEEPDLEMPKGKYYDIRTGAQTMEMFLATPMNRRTFTRGVPPTTISAPTTMTRRIPTTITPPGYPATPPTQPVIALIAQITGQSEQVISANTHFQLIAVGQFLADGATTGVLDGGRFDVTKVMKFEMRIRTAYVYVPSGANAALPVTVLVGFLDYGLLHSLLGEPPPANATDTVRFEWRAPMTLSTETLFARPTAGEPTPRAIPFGAPEIRFEGQPVDDAGIYSIVGSAQGVALTAPANLCQFLFGTPTPNDIEWAMMETGRLVPQ